MLTRSSLVLTALAGLAVAVPVVVTPAMAQKGEPSSPSPGANTCEKFKKGTDAWKKCTRTSLLEGSNDEQLFYAGYWLARTGQYGEALTYLNRAEVRDERILTYIGFATRKLGDHTAALDFYARALAMNPDYTVARAYLGEAYLEQGETAKARAQLAEIARRCGTACVEYRELDAEIAKRAAKG